MYKMLKLMQNKIIHDKKPSIKLEISFERNWMHLLYVQSIKAIQYSCV